MELEEVTVTTFDAVTGERLSTETVLVPAPPPEVVAADALAAQTARIETAVQDGWMTDEQRDALLG